MSVCFRDERAAAGSLCPQAANRLTLISPRRKTAIRIEAKLRDGSKA